MHAGAKRASVDVVRPLPTIDHAKLGVAEPWSCPEYGRDYVKLAAWIFALLFGPALVALAVLLA
jgi:hypothetical protein